MNTSNGSSDQIWKKIIVESRSSMQKKKKNRMTILFWTICVYGPVHSVSTMHVFNTFYCLEFCDSVWLVERFAFHTEHVS